MKVNPQTDQFGAVPQHTDTAKPAAGDQTFNKVLGGAIQVAGQLASTVAGAQGLGLGSLGTSLASGLTGGAGGAGGIGGSGGDPSFQDLLTLQTQLQRESLVFNSQTNISKTDHETRMSAVRNIKA